MTRIAERKYNVLLIPADDQLPISLQSIERSKELEQLQRLVGGNIEIAPCRSSKFTIFVNEDATSLPTNARATHLWRDIWEGCEEAIAVMVGNMIVCGAPDKNGDQLGLPKSLIKLMLPKA